MSNFGATTTLITFLKGNNYVAVYVSLKAAAEADRNKAAVALAKTVSARL